jgi:S-adenosylmethionine decarboxylase
MTTHRPAGLHLLADLHGIAPALLTAPAQLDALLREAALAAGACILHSHFHAFGEGLGVTGVLLLAESHISIHTWPEAGFAAADVFMCGACQPQRALEVLEAALQPAARSIRTVARGQL